MIVVSVRRNTRSNLFATSPRDTQVASMHEQHVSQKATIFPSTRLLLNPSSPLMTNLSTLKLALVLKT